MKLKKFGSTEQRVYDLVKPITDELGYFLWDVAYEKEGAMWYLRVFIDQDEGISIDDCERATRPINDILDREDPISQSYVLEVGSAGLERELVKPEHFEVCMGDEVRVHFIRAVDGVKEITGILSGADKESVTVTDENGQEKSYALSDISYVKLYMEFE
ncbi:MAG: ribosome maturation factor RimP [Ruminococcus sp.]|nr:ribosome maturation factor RimP [Ruminococcus sp.]